MVLIEGKLLCKEITYRSKQSMVFGLLIFLSILSNNAIAQPAGYQFYKDITIQASQVQGSLTDFPVLINITDNDLRTVANGGGVTNGNGFDIIFTNSDGSIVLNHRLETYSATTGAIVAWVRVSSLSNISNTTIRAYYGNSSVTTDQSNNNVWDNNYAMVQNLSGNFTDRTNNGNNGINSGTTNIVGKIGNARNLNGTSQYITIPNSPTLNMDVNDQVTVSAWVWKDAQQTGWRAVTQKSDQSYNLQFNEGTNQPVFTIYDGTWNNAIAPTAVPINQWSYLTGTFDGTNIRLYVNGVQVNTGTATQITASNLDIGIGENIDANGRFIDGRIDEVRISNIARSANWIGTEYANQNNPSAFYSVGSQQLSDSSAPTAPQNVSASKLEGGNIQISFDDVDETGSGVSSYSVKRSITSGTAYTQIGIVNDNESASYTFTDNTASNGITYYYIVTAIDGASNESISSAEVSETSDASLPLLETATINQTILNLDYSETLKTNSIPSPSDFTVTVNSAGITISQVQIAGELVILTVSPEVEQGDVVVVNYTADLNPIEDNAGNNAANLTNEAVSNSTSSLLPTPPNEITATAVIGGDIEITFQDVNSSNTISSYIIKRATTEGGPYTTIGTVTDNESSSYTYIDNTTSEGTSYFYVVASMDVSSQESANSEEVFATADATSPFLQVATINGEFLSLDYNENLNVTSIPSPSDFSVLVNGIGRTVSEVNVNGSRAILTLNPEIISGDNVVINYTIGVNPIRDIAGNNATSISAQNAVNNAFNTAMYGPDPCPISNGQDAAWACFSGVNEGTTMNASVGGLEIATVTTVTANTTFAPNALQQWASGEFSGDQFNGPQVNPNGASGNATSFDIVIPAVIPSDALILSLNKLSPNAGATSYTLEAFDGLNNKVTVNDWITGQGTDGGVCTNTVNLAYTNANTTIEFQPTASANPACASISTPIWFRITDTNVERIEIRKVASQPDNIHFGLAVVADFGDAPATFGTVYSGSGNPPAFHLLNNGSANNVFFGSTVDADGNGLPSATANVDDDDAITSLLNFNAAQTSYSTTLSCSNGGNVGGWIDFDQSDTFDPNEFALGVCSSNSVTLTWTGLSGLNTGITFARFRIASSINDVLYPIGAALDGEVEDYQVEIIVPPTPDLSINKTVNVPNPIVGQSIAFTISVTNPGIFEASGIKVFDQLPSGLTYVSASATQGLYNSSSGIWNIGTLPEGDSTIVSLTINAIVNSGTLGNTIVNTASITQLNETDPELNNNSASAGITVVPESTDISIDISVSDMTPIEGEFVDYTITVTNNGPQTAQNLSILAQIPSGLTYFDSTVTTGSFNPTTGLWNIGSLAVGNSEVLVVSARVNGGTEGTTIVYSSGLNNMSQFDPNESNNTDTAPISIDIPIGNLTCGDGFPSFNNSTLISGSDLQVGAKYRFDSILPGVFAEVEILTINNLQILQLDAPGTQSGVGSDAEFAPYINNNNTGDGYVDFKISFFDSTSGLEKYLTFSATAADVDGTGDLRDYIGYENLSSFVVENTTNLIPGTSDLYATFISSDFNNTLPGNADFTDYKVYASYTNETEFRVRMGIDANNTQSSRIISLNFDPCELNTFTNPISNPIVDIAVLKNVDDNSVTTGQQVTYTITAENKKASAAGGIEVTDQLPTGLTFVSSNPSQGSYSNSTGIWNVGSLSGLQSATLELVASVNTGTQGDIITNSASLTNVTGNDGLGTNNESSIDILVFDPNSGLTCSEPPTFSFVNYILIQGVQNQVNSIYRYTNVAPGIDAIVTIDNIVNVTFDAFDDDGTVAGNQATVSSFSPIVTTVNGTSDGYVDWNFQFVLSGTNIPVKRNFSVTATDIDGTDIGGGQTIRDFYGFTQNFSNTVQAGNNLDPIFNQGNFEIFRSGVLTDASGNLDIDHIAYIRYNYTSEFKVRTGSTPTGGYPNPRLVELNFTPCLNQEFTNPIISTRDSDISIVKTVDEANPLENETINFTLTVTNNGPEDATEIDVTESIPSGLTLIQSTPSQGTYNQLLDLWTVGALANGASATLQLETSVNSGVLADSLINKVFVKGLNQNDPNITNDTSQVVIKIGVELKGVVFQDITGNGFSEDMIFNDAAGDQRALENVEVHLFKDGGDGNADGNDDTFIQTKLTSNLGEYSFKIGDDANYWVVVDSKTGDLSDGNTWAEQTYAPIGGLCEDGLGNSTFKLTSGHCFGGRRSTISDNISDNPSVSDLINAEHLAKVTIGGTSVYNIDFGFSFNVVTHISDSDLDLGFGRYSQGSLHQFILNANSITGANSMRFIPVVPTNSSGGGGNWWTTSLTAELPTITDALTTIDGTAYLLTAPKTIRDDNSGTIANGGVVGIDNISIPSMLKKEFEIDLNDVGLNAISINTNGSYAIRNIAVFNGQAGINVQSGSNGIVEKNFIGTLADGSNPSGASRAEIGINFSGVSSASTLIQENLIAFLTNSGIKSSNSSATLTIFKNEIYQTALNDNQADGIEGIATWLITQNLIHEIGNSGSLSQNGGSGIEIGANSGISASNTIRNNTIRNNKIAGIHILNGVTNTLVEKNIINGNGTNFISGSPTQGAGIKLASPNGAAQSGIKITKNSFYGNYGIPIDVVYLNGTVSDGVSPNDGIVQSSNTTPNRGLDYPVFTLSTLNGNILHVEGYIGTNTTKLQSAYTIEVYKSDNDGNNDGLIEVGGASNVAHGEGRYLVGTFTTNSNGTFNVDINVPGTVSLAFNDRISAIAISSANNTSEFSANQRVVPTGVGISGYVFNDINHNMVKDPSEVGLENITIVLYDVTQNNCKSVLTNSTGKYEFTNVLNGSYDLIESFGQSVPTPDICTPAQVDPTNFISTTPNLRSVTVNNLPVFQDFGDFEGVKIMGTVINDNGVGSGTANDGIKNGGEQGLPSQILKVVTSSNTIIEQVVSAADGTYALYVPASAVTNGGAVKVIEVNGTNTISTGGSAGTTLGTYSIATDETAFNIAYGTIYTGVDFANVPVSRLLTDGERSVIPGAVVVFQHLFDANTAGDVLFTTNSISNPTNPNWPVVVYQDVNCSGVIDSGEPIILPNVPISVTADQNVCVLVKVTAPYGLNDGASNTTTLTATFSYANTLPIIQEILTRTDLVTVGTVTAGLVILKSVDKPQALPGTNLVYSINYENLGDEPISEVEIVDVIPSFTTYVSSSCGTLPVGITNCSITAPNVGASGPVKWTFTGTLDPGKNGVVTFIVKIDN